MPLNRIIILSSLAGLIVCSPFAFGHSSSNDVELPFDEVVVVATKHESAIRDIAANVTVVDNDELDATFSASLEDLFRYVPGVTHQSSGSRFGSEGLIVRGIGGNRIAMELDGVPLSDHFSVGNFSNATRDFTDAGIIGTAELMRGPASALYGSSALGGVLSMRTLRAADVLGPGEAIGGRATFAARGIDDSRHVTAAFGIRGETLSLIVAGSARDGNERESAALESPADTLSYQNDAGLLGLSGGNRLGHAWKVSAVRQTRSTESSISSVLGSGRFRSTTRLEGDDRHVIDLGSFEYRFGTAALTEGMFRVFAADASIDQQTLDERALARTPVSIDRSFTFDQDLRGAELNLWRDIELAGWSHRFGFGVEYTEAKTVELRDGLSTNLGDGSQTSSILGEEFPVRDFPVTTTRTVGAYLSDQLDRGPLSLILALRFDESRLDPSEDSIYRADNPATTAVSLTDSDLSPKIGAIYRVGDNLDLYLQYAHGFRAPPFEDANIGLDIPLFNVRAIPNPDLRSETSDGWEAGLRWAGTRTRWKLSAFHTRYRDFIDSKSRIGVDPDSGRLLFQSVNIANADIHGVEASVEYDFDDYVRGLRILASASWTRGDNRDDDAPLNSVGPAEAVLGAVWLSQDERSELRVMLTAVDGWSRRDESDGDLFKPGGYGVIDAFYRHRFGNALTLRGGVGNMTDRTYWRWSEVGGLAPDDVLLPTLAESGRHYSIGLQWDF